jgi:Ser/Thr protein kinase RdoA (MazF antagonist)
VVEDLVAYARTAFGWDGDVQVSAGPRGALGQIWRIETGPVRYALKEIFDEPPTEASIAVELDFVQRAAESGVRAPASFPDRDGRYLVTTPDGTWLRCYEWLDLHPLARTAATPQRLGALLARLHRCAPAGTDEPNGGGPADPWYDHPPAMREWAELRTSGLPWAGRLADRLVDAPRLCATVRPADPNRLVICHRDLHPENVHVDPAGTLIVVDWDDMGPAEPGQELARVLVDWCCDDASTDRDAVRAIVGAYRDAGGPGVVTELADFSMLVASRLNFVLGVVRLALDPQAQPRHREWAEHEADGALHLIPTHAQVSDVLAATRECFRRDA